MCNCVEQLLLFAYYTKIVRLQYFLSPNLGNAIKISLKPTYQCFYQEVRQPFLCRIDQIAPLFSL